MYDVQLIITTFFVYKNISHRLHIYNIFFYFRSERQRMIKRPFSLEKNNFFEIFGIDIYIEREKIIEALT